MPAVGEPPPEPGGQNTRSESHGHEVSARATVTPPGVGDSAPKQMRSFKQILAEEQASRNILEIKLTKMMVEVEGVMCKARNISFEDVSTLIFDTIGVKPEHCLGVALNTARYDTKEIKLKPGVDPTQYTTKDTLITFKDHQVEVTIQCSSVTRVTFKNVPFNIPDEEIVNLCECYGEPINNAVHYDKPNRATRGVPGSTRYVDMKILPGKQFENFYWMEGPMDNDRGCRITVLHNGQLQQCSHCLRRKDSCPGGGVGKLCEKKGTPKGMISDYMKHLKLHHNYSSLKMKYMQEEFPLLDSPRQLDDGFGHMVEKDEDEESGLVNKGESNNLETKDARIKDLEAQLSDQNELRQKLTETKARLEIMRKEKAARTLVIPQNFFEYNDTTDEVKVIDEIEFDNFVEKKCKGGQNRESRKEEIKNKLLEQVKQTERRKRGLSISSIASLGLSDTSSRIRNRSNDSDGGGDAKHSKLSPTLPVS